MLRLRLRSVVAATMLLMSSAVSFGQMSRLLVTRDTAGGFDQKIDHPAPHPLSWWTQNEQKLFTTWNQSPGRQAITTVGTVSGHKVIQILITDTSPHSPDVWLGLQMKSLLVQVAHSHRYAEIYRIEDDGGLFVAFQPARAYSSGSDLILTTIDPGYGNSGGCVYRYWWFNATGAHPVDFSLFDRAVAKATPAQGINESRCWALHPERSELQSLVQSRNRSCTSCDFMGELTAKYRIEHGRAIPVSVHFHANPSPN